MAPIASMSSRVLRVDMDELLAAVELLRHPELAGCLAGCPVIVGGHGDRTARAVVSTASYAARGRPRGALVGVRAEMTALVLGSVGRVGLVRSVNVAGHTVAVPYKDRPTGIGKRPVAGAVHVREPGPKHGGLGSGLLGDTIGDQRHHGGTGQAVYAFARERLDVWAERLGRDLPDGVFGENLTTVGVDVDGALIGERWRIGGVDLQVTGPRVPCGTFRGRMGEPGWLRMFVADAHPGAYLGVVHEGGLRAGDTVTVVHRPAHDVTVALAFRAMVRDATLLPQLRPAWDHLGDEIRELVDAGRTFSLG